MHLHAYRVKNYRRLQDVHIELGKEISIFVGANNSGKTSATQIVHTFVKANKDRLTLFDFSAQSWKLFDDAGNLEQAPTSLPTIALDLWLNVEEADLHLVLPLLPSYKWKGAQVGLRIEFSAKNAADLHARFRDIRDNAKQRADKLEGGPGKYAPWPKTLTDYLEKELKNEFEFNYYVLDRAQFDERYREKTQEYLPDKLAGEPGGASVVRSLIQVDNLGAQRHLSDPISGYSSSSGRAEDLSKRMSRFYQQNLDQRQDDHAALRALFNSEAELNDHLEKVFEPTLSRLATLGYPGVNNPILKIRSALNPATIMNQDARVHYHVDGTDKGLPDIYNGLGFKNLIYMVVEILDVQARWKSDKDRAPLHLVFVEEPEAHLHAQLQQVFIRNVLELLKLDGEGESAFQNQVVITTHSPHIVYERGFKPIRYFRRELFQEQQITTVLNLSAFYEAQAGDRDFLERYLKLTHCDLFFADAAILVEGNVERLLLPIMIEREALSLRSSSICILEVGGAFAHRFKSLLEFLGLIALILTDLDSVTVVPEKDEDQDTEFEVPNAGAKEKKYGRRCLPDVAGAVTSNQALINWLPKKQTIADLWATTAADCTQLPTEHSASHIYVAFQRARDVTWNGETKKLCGRTLEEAFGLENAEFCQKDEGKALGLKLKKAPTTAAELAIGLSNRVNSNSFNKTNFALAVLTQPISSWTAPDYIRDGLTWLVTLLEPEKDEKIAPELKAQVAE